MKSHQKVKPGKATGIDRVTKEMYEEHLEENVAKLKQKSYRPLPVRRTYIPKDEKINHP